MQVAVGSGAPGLVTVHLWGVRRATVPRALARMATQRRALARLPGLSFAKLLGTGSGQTFDFRDADLTHWALVACWQHPGDAVLLSDGPLGLAWGRDAVETLSMRLAPLTSRGRWSGCEPFGAGDPSPPRWGGPVVAITRARLVPRRAREFWRAVPAVTADLHRSDVSAPVVTVGIGEAPIGLQGTVSLWRSAADLADFAYRRSAHVAVMAETSQRGWYAEELFARFAVREVTGSYRGESITLRGGGGPAPHREEGC